MSVDLRSYVAIESAVLLRWEVPDLDPAYLTDYSQNIANAGNNYINIGNLLSISGPTSELKASPNEITITLSGIPTNAVSDILNRQIKGSKLWIYRAFFDVNSPSTLIDLSPAGGVQNTLLKFRGIVTNYSISDSVEVEPKLATTTITLTCSSLVEVLNKKRTGRRTNPQDFPTTQAMSRVQALANSNFNFGAPQ
jgi:hypothetical protein